MVWNVAECKCPLEVFLAGVSTKRATEQHMHLNRNKTRKINRNSLINFPLHRFSKHPHWFRCSGKGKHLNPAARQNPSAKPLTTNALQDFQRLCPWFRSLAGLPLRAAPCRERVVSCLSFTNLADRGTKKQPAANATSCSPVR